jgi:hypothetical protein
MYEYTGSVGMWYLSGDVVAQWRCGGSVGMWYLSGDVVAQWRCGSSVGRWWLRGDVVPLWGCGGSGYDGSIEDVETVEERSKQKSTYQVLVT